MHGLNTCMKCSEILPPFTCYRVFVRLKTGMSGSTLVFAENVAFARDLAFALYGPRNVVSVVVNEESDQTNESTNSIKPPDPAKQRIQSLRDQAKRYRDMAKQEQARQKIQKANQTLTRINRQPSKPATR